MIPEIGHFTLIVALILSFISTGLGLFNKAQAFKMAKALLVSQLLCVFISVASLIFCALVDDFSVDYIANHSNTYLPLMYKATMLWGAHEGSMLLWLFILNIWSLVLLHGDLKEYRIHAVSFMAVLQFGIVLFILATSNPFLRLLPNAPIQGADLNPLLQDPGFVIHPPILYLGYVGLSVPFVLSLCAIMRQNFSQALIYHMKRATLLAWSFLTLGITLGSWWAYYELGWGGWWFWDPVENASLMPWLASCALLHVLVIYEKRQIFPGLVTFLAILSFAMSLLGTFLVRSGVLTSVHSFASSPGRGAFILVLFAITIGGAFILYASKMRKYPSMQLQPWSRELMLLSQALCMLIALSTILLGTLYPILMDALFSERLSVGAPYFNTILVPFFAVMIFLMGFAPSCYWDKNTFHKLKKPIAIMALAVFVLFLIGLGLSLPFWHAVIFALSISVFVATLTRLAPKHWGKPMVLAHVGLMVSALAIALSTAYDFENDFAVQEGSQVTSGQYDFTIEKFTEVDNPHHTAIIAHVNVTKDGKQITRLYPEKRYFKARQMALSETAIRAGVFLDLYVSMGEPLEQGWSIRVYSKPFVRWIWIGALMMAISGIMSSYQLKFLRLRKRREVYG